MPVNTAEPLEARLGWRFNAPDRDKSQERLGVAVQTAFNEFYHSSDQQQKTFMQQYSEHILDIVFNALLKNISPTIFSKQTLRALLCDLKYKPTPKADDETLVPICQLLIIKSALTLAESNSANKQLQ